MTARFPDLRVETVPDRCANVECPNRFHEGRFARVATGIAVGPTAAPHRHITLWMCTPCASAFQAHADTEPHHESGLPSNRGSRNWQPAKVSVCISHSRNGGGEEHVYAGASGRRLLVCLGDNVRHRQGDLIEVIVEDDSDYVVDIRPDLTPASRGDR